MALDLRQLRHVLEVGRVGSFSRAAETLHISQSALSRSVAKFEDSIGEPLFDRTPRGVVATELAAPILRDIELLLARAARLEQDLRQRATGEAGAIAFGVGPMFAACLLPPLMLRAAEMGPRVKVQAQVDSAANLLSGLERGDLEFCITAETLVPHGSDLVIERLAEVELGFLARRAHPLHARSGVTVAEISAFPLATGSMPEEAWDEPTRDRAFPAPTIMCENFAVLQRCAEDSDLVWITSPALLDPAARDRLAPLVLSDWQAPRHAVCAVFPAGRSRSPLAQGFLAAASAALGQATAARSGLSFPG